MAKNKSKKKKSTKRRESDAEFKERMIRQIARKKAAKIIEERGMK